MKTYLLPIAVIVLVGALLHDCSARAEDCPKGARSCVVITVTPEEAATLTNPGGIFDLAVWANRAGASSLVEAWKRKIETAPSGTVVDPKNEPAKQD